MERMTDQKANFIPGNSALGKDNPAIRSTVRLSCSDEGVA